jgi:uncharacterized protein YcbK (DUF882 family)
MEINLQLSPHFRLREFLHNGSAEGISAAILKNLRALANRLEAARILVGNQPIQINSGFRTPEHNRAVGGQKNSFHMRGMAADIIVPGMPAHEVQARLSAWQGGLGSYRHFTHLDIRPYRARWTQL